MLKAAYYFGCYKDPGHYLFDVSMRRVYKPKLPDDFPVNPDILDAGLLPPKLPQVEGQIFLNHINGWTILSFWDRSIDKRPSSNSAFVIRGIHKADEAFRLADESFHDVVARCEYLTIGNPL